MRDVFITFNPSTGFYLLLLRESQVSKESRTTNNYHELGGIISNWINNGY